MVTMDSRKWMLRGLRTGLCLVPLLSLGGLAALARADEAVATDGGLGVVFNFAGAQAGESHAGRFRIDNGSGGVAQADSGYDRVLPAGKLGQHLKCVHGIARFFENLPIQDHDRIGAQYDFRVVIEHCLGFLASQTADVGFRGLAWGKHFLDGSRAHCESDPRGYQQLTPPR